MKQLDNVGLPTSYQITTVLKKAIWEECIAYVEQRISTARQALTLAREAAQDDTKSSAGDKYETTREMMQQDLGRNERLLAEAHQMLDTLHKLSFDIPLDRALLGSVVKTSQGSFYLSIPVGAIQVMGRTYFAISPDSPIGKYLLGAKKGDQVSFNQKVYQVLEVV